MLLIWTQIRKSKLKHNLWNYDWHFVFKFLKVVKSTKLNAEWFTISIEIWRMWNPLEGKERIHCLSKMSGLHIIWTKNVLKNVLIASKSTKFQDHQSPPFKSFEIKRGVSERFHEDFESLQNSFSLQNFKTSKQCALRHCLPSEKILGRTKTKDEVIHLR